MKKIGISFKDSEFALYEFLKKQLSPSIYIKQLIKEQMEKENETNKRDNNTIQNNFDF
ncbi:MAG: hypothetical protein E6248_11970 [Clostridium sp.]|uniref:hypothetical protein n=1 Tax=Clostridium sp. TaxID=1506 RepID=UPI00290F224A|nr:hypothetical protein [Clostridium sp.]MDU5111158.1 hypothetical protein [Clostridium sp.]